ncbi:MAG: O-antigen ligase family protein [Actinomycetota bacterium]|nr:O-antigen ligase family protein [Actinomycetota bacterium]
MAARRLGIDGLLLATGAAVALLWPLSAYAVGPILFPAAALAVLGFVAIARWPVVGIALIVAAVPLTRLAFPALGGLQPLTVLLPVLAVALFAYVLLVARREHRLHHRGIVPAVGAFLLVATVSALQGIDSRESLGQLAVLLSGGALLLAVLQACRERSDLLVVAVGICLALVIASVHGLIQQSGGEFDQSSSIGGDIVGRVSGTFGHPNQYAGFLAVLIPVAVAIALSKAFPSRMRWLAGGAVALALPALTLSYARGAIGGLIVGSVVWLAIVRPRVAWVVVVAMIAAGVISAPSLLKERLSDVGTSQVALRSDLWRSALGVYSESPVLGVGIDNFSEAYESLPSTVEAASQRRLLHNEQVLVPPHANNLYLNVLAEQGLVGLCALAWLAFGAVAIAYRGSRVADPAGRAFCLGLGASLMTFAFHNLLEVTLADLFLPLLALLAVASVFVIRDERDAGKGEKEPSQAGLRRLHSP